MELTGIAFRGPQLKSVRPGDEFGEDPRTILAPLDKSFIPINRFTGIVGRNDTGKTRLLKVVEDALDPPHDPDLALISSILFFSCSQDELEVLTQQATLDLADFDDEGFALEKIPQEADRVRLWDRRTDLQGEVLGEATLIRERPAIEQYAEILERAWTRDRGAFSRVIQAATTAQSEFDSSKQTVALRKFGDYWAVYWCVPPASECSDALRSDLRACLLGPGISYEKFRKQLLFGGRAIQDLTTYGWSEEAPIPIAPIGLTALSLAPKSLRASDLDEVVRGLEETFGEFAIRTKRLEALINADFSILDDDYHIPGYGISPSATREALSKAWIRPTSTGGYEVNPDIVLQAEQVGILANELLPSFIKSDYLLKVKVNDPTKWGREPRLKVTLSKKRGAPAERQTGNVAGVRTEIEARPYAKEFWPGHEFPADRIAQGFRLWIGIALTEASTLFDTVGEQLEHFIEDVIDAEGWAEEETRPSGEAAEAALQAARTVVDTMEEATAGEPLYRPLDEYLEWRRLTPWMLARAKQHRGLVYLLDEPERHLHPALQRQAAQWLQERLESSGFQAVVATHSLSFMSVSGNASFTYLVREPEAPTVLLSINPRELDSLSLAATELGIDRGELLSLINLFLWVEGYSEQVILEALFGPELRELGVKVIPLHGHPGARGILDSRIHSFTSARAAVWLDAISPEFVAKAEANPGVKTSSPEEKTLAQVIRSARESEIPIVPISVEYPGDDVFDLLDDLAIESEYPNYPGHEEAHRLWAEAREKGAKVGSRKDFWAQKFKTPINPESCQIIAARMRRERRVTPQLASVLEQCRTIVES